MLIYLFWFITAILYIFAFIITYESLPFFRRFFDEDHYNAREFVFGGLIYSFWKKYAIKNGFNPKRSYTKLGLILAIIFYIIPFISLILWKIWDTISYSNDTSVASVTAIRFLIIILLIVIIGPIFIDKLLSFSDNIMKNAEYEEIDQKTELSEGLDLIFESNQNISSLLVLKKLVKNIISSDSYYTLQVNLEIFKKFFIELPKEERIKLQDVLTNSPEKNDFIIALLEYSITPNHPKEAIYWLSNAIDKNPGKNSIYYTCRGFIFKEINDDDNAYTDLKEACISGNVAAISFLILKYEDRLVKDLNNCIDNKEKEDENSKDRIFISNIQKLLLGATDLGISDDDRLMAEIDEDWYLADYIVNSIFAGSDNS